MARTVKSNDSFHFEGFASPNTTPVPDVVFDRLLTQLGEAELKALLYIIRRTFGFKRERDSISFNQFLRGITTRDGRVLDQGAGIRNRTALSNALKSLEVKGIVTSDKGIDERGENATTVYRLRFRSDGVVRETYHRGTDGAPPVVRQAYPQQTGLQQTVRPESILSKEQTLGLAKGEGVGGGKTVPSKDKPDLVYERPATKPSREQMLPASVGDILATHRRPRSPRLSSARTGPTQPTPYIESLITQFGIEFNDIGHLRSNLSQAMHLFSAKGYAEAIFCQRVYEAAAITRDQGHTRRLTGSAKVIRNRMPYFFAVLRDLLDLPSAEPHRLPPTPDRRVRQGHTTSPLGRRDTQAHPVRDTKEFKRG